MFTKRSFTLGVLGATTLISFSTQVDAQNFYTAVPSVSYYRPRPLLRPFSYAPAVTYKPAVVAPATTFAPVKLYNAPAVVPSYYSPAVAPAAVSAVVPAAISIPVTSNYVPSYIAPMTTYYPNW